VVQRSIWEAPRTQATAARGTDAKRTEEAAPVVVDDLLVVAADAEDLLVPDDEVARLVVVGTVVVVAFPIEVVAADVVGRSDGGMLGTVPLLVPDITDGNVSIFPSLPLRATSSEKHGT
jgi:hypothetical protein